MIFINKTWFLVIAFALLIGRVESSGNGSGAETTTPESLESTTISTSENVATTTTARTGNMNAYISIGADSVGYVLSLSYVVFLAALYAMYWVTRLIRCNNLSDNKIYIPEEQMTQRGFVFSRFGLILQILTYGFGLWLYVAMLMAIIGHYQDQWPFDLSIAKGSVDWDSFTRVFMAAWLGSIVVAIVARIFRHRMESFYLRPSSLSVAKYIKVSQVVTDVRGQALNVLHQEVLPIDFIPVRHINFLLKTLVWSDKDCMFVPGRFFPNHHPRASEADAIRRIGGLSAGAAADRTRDFGRNEISLTVPSIYSMLGGELSSFFYMYQISAGCLLSLYWDYITAGLLSLVLIVGSACIKAIMERREKLAMHAVATLQGSVWVKRDQHWTKVTSQELVVGDLVCLADDSAETSKEITVDCVVVSGSVVVDESALTGETMPVEKTPCVTPDTVLTPENCRGHFLFAGTRILQASDALDEERPGSVASAALAVVTATGGSTMRGELIRSLVYGSPSETILAKEFTVALLILASLAGLNFWIVNVSYTMSMSTVLPAITSIVGLISPLLTVALLGGEIRSAQRLKVSGIKVKELERLTAAGKTDFLLLDKTGTITKSGLAFAGVVPAHSEKIVECLSKDTAVPAELAACLALAHSVTRVNGGLVGHEVELRMVETAMSLGWNMTDLRAPTDASGTQWNVERLFPFSHETMTMSALVNGHGQRAVVCKGSFEAMSSRCLDISDETKQACGIFAQEGYYVLAAGMRLLEQDQLPSADAARDTIERELSFVGLMLFRNPVKEDSGEAISTLQKAGVEVAMVTGDSVFTATAVARAVGILPANRKIVIGLIDAKSKQTEWRLADTDSLISEESLASDSQAILCVTGEVFDRLRAEAKLEPTRIRVYARVSPCQKAEIVNLYGNMGKTVMMCGDGANDSIALRTSHAGLALCSKAEANVAAPFSTELVSLTALVLLLREGRAALTTSLAAYRYLVAVGLIQTVSKTVLYLQCGGFLSGVACLLIDCVQVPLLLYGICSAMPAAKLAPHAPEGSLLGPEMVLGTAWTVITGVLVLGISEAVLVSADWFVPFTTTAPMAAWRQRTDTFESALVVLVRLWMYADIALVYSYGSVHRRPTLTNWKLVITAIAVFALIGFVLFGPVGIVQAALTVNVTKAVSIGAADTFLNNFLFYYEKIGGVWYGVTDSIEYPQKFSISLVSIFVSMAIVHHVGFKLGVLGPVTRWCHQTLGWKDGACGICKRRRYRGYKPLSVQVAKFDALDESIVNVAKEESPAAEWELRRTYGRWRAPVAQEYT